MTTALNAIIWVSVAICLVASLASIFNWRKTMRNVRNMNLLYAREAPPVDVVEVHLKTGEVVTVQPVNPHRSYVWMVPMPCAPDEVDEVVIPDLPPWTRLVPVPYEFAEQQP